MKNIFKTSEFANAGASLAANILGGQPNARDSAAYNNAMNTGRYAQGLAQQEAIRDAKKKEKEEKKKKAFGSVGTILGTIAAAAIPGVGPLLAPLVAGAGGAVGGAVGERIAGGGGGSFGDIAMQYGVPAAISAAPAAGRELMENASGPQFNGTGMLNNDVISKPKKYKLGQALSSLDERYMLKPRMNSEVFDVYPETWSAL